MTGFAGTGALVRLALRRDRLRIPLWVLGLVGIVAVSGSAVGDVYADPSAIEGYSRLVGSSPVTVAFAGPPVGLTTLAGIVVYEVYFTAILGVGLMAITMTTRHSRAEEESGRSELVRSTEVGRYAGGAAALLVTVLASGLLAGALWLALLPTALGPGPAALFSAGIALLGVVFSAATLCVAQLFVHARTATGAGLALFGVAYALRAAGDVRGDWLVWLSPVGWVQATHVPAENRVWPLLLPLLATVLLVALAVDLAGRRDFGGGLLPSRPGRPTASPSLSGVVGLAWRLQRGSTLAWGTALLAFAVLSGALGSSVQDLVESNPTLEEYFQASGEGSVTGSYLASMVLILALVAGGFAVWSARQPWSEESAGRAEMVLAAPVSRYRWLLGHLVVTLAATTLLLLVTATGLGATFASVTGDLQDGWRAAGAQLTYLPAVLVMAAVAVLLQGWVPAWSWMAWVVLGFSLVIGWLGGLLRPPQWLVDLSPFSQVPRVPLESAADPALAVLVLAAALLVAAGLGGFRHRDVR